MKYRTIMSEKTTMGSEHLPDHNPNMQADWTYCTRPQSIDDEACEGFHSHRVKFYNDNWKEYEPDSFIQNYTGAFYVAMTTAKYLEGNYGAKILDLAGGTGFVAQELKKVGDFNNIDVLDPAENLVKLATDRGLYKNTYLQYFTENCGLPEASYDAVVCAGGYFPGGLRAHSVVEMARLIKPGGLMVLGVRSWFVETDPDCMTLPAEFKNLVDNGTYEQLERSVVPKWHAGMPGQVWAFFKK